MDFYNDNFLLVLCRSMGKGNLLDWDRATLDLVNMTAREEDPAELCRPVRPGHVIFPLRRNFSESVSLCRKMRGLTSVMKDRETQDALRGVLREHRACGDPDEGAISYFSCNVPCYGAWTGV